jgi:hypothetical protein
MTVESVIDYIKIDPYQVLRKNINDKKNSLQFLPKCLEEVSKSKNFYWNGQKLKSSYLVDIVHNLILKFYFKKENKFHLHSTILKEKYGYLYNYYISWLENKGVLILMFNHQKGKNSRIYSLQSAIFSSQILRFNNPDRVLLKKFKAKVCQIETPQEDKNLIEKDIRIKLVNDLYGVQIQFDRAIFFLENLKDNQVDIYNRNKYSVESINQSHIFFHFDNYGRMHTNFTILKSYIRKNCLLIDGEETCEIDIKNSQPLFLSKLIIDANSKWINSDELELLKQLTISGKYYNYLMDNLGNIRREEAKEMTYKVFFGRNGTNSRADKNFAKLFPTIHNFIKLYKREHGDYKILAYDLQRSESNLIFNKIIKSIMQINPEIKIVTVHDSLIVQRRHFNEVNSIFQTKLLEEFGII